MRVFFFFIVLHVLSGRQNLSHRHNGYSEVLLDIKIMKMSWVFFVLSAGDEENRGRKEPMGTSNKTRNNIPM